MRNQYIVKEDDIQLRKEFFNYIINKYNLNLYYPFTKDEFNKSHFPFIVDFEENSFWICDSITCLAAAATAGVIFTIDEFKKLRR